MSETFTVYVCPECGSQALSQGDDCLHSQGEDDHLRPVRRQPVEATWLAASPGAGELDLTDEEIEALLHRMEQLEDDMDREGFNWLVAQGILRGDYQSAKAKLRARLGEEHN